MHTKFLFLLLIPLGLWSQTPSRFSLNEAISYAQTHAYALKDAADDIRIAQKKVWETTAMGFPQINAKADYQNFIEQPVQLIPAQFFGGPEGEFAEMTFGTKQNMNASATLTQLLFSGSYLVGLQSAKVYKKISESIREKTAISIEEAVTNAYAGVLMTQEGIRIMQKNKEILEKSLKDTKELYKNGFIEEQDVEQLSLTLAQLDNELENLQRRAKYNLQMLQFSMGIDVDKEIILTQSLEELLETHTGLGIISEPLNYEKHIDYRIVENSVSASELMLKLEKSKALPSLHAYINYGYKANNESFDFFESGQKWYDSSIFGVQLNIPIFSSLQRYSRIQQAKIGVEKALRKREETVQKLKLQHQKALLEYQNSLENYRTGKANLALATRIENKERIKFFEGVSGSFALSQAQAQLYRQQQAYLQSVFALINKRIALKNSLGK